MKNPTFNKCVKKHLMDVHRKNVRLTEANSASQIQWSTTAQRKSTDNNKHRVGSGRVEKSFLP